MPKIWSNVKSWDPHIADIQNSTAKLLGNKAEHIFRKIGQSLFPLCSVSKAESRLDHYILNGIFKRL